MRAFPVSIGSVELIMRTPSDIDSGNIDQVKWASGLNIIAGIWLLISPWVLQFSDLRSVMTNDVVFGVVVGVLAAIRAFGAYRVSWLSWINLLVGIWLVISAFTMVSSAVPKPFWNNVILGVIVGVLSIVS